MRRDFTDRSVKCHRGGAFTLVEFILVMALLATVMAVAAPSLSKFFSGRKLESEARRFVALARYGQSMAASEGLPMVLWIDRSRGTYGVRPQDEYLFQELPSESVRAGLRNGSEAVNATLPQFRLGENLSFDVEVLGRTNTQFVMIRLLPDGSIDEASLRVLQILRASGDDAGKTEKIWIAQSRDQSRYEIVDETNVWERIDPQARFAGRGIYLR